IEEVFTETVIDSTGPSSRSSPRVKFAVAAEDGGSDLRLRRSDIDAFERSLVHRKYLIGAGAVLFVLAGAGAAVWAFTREPPPHPPPVTEEHEPNDDAAHANKIAANSEVHGYIGKRRAIDEGDRDVFVVPWSSGTRHLVTVRVSGVPNLDLHLQVADGDGLHS